MKIDESINAGARLSHKQLIAAFGVFFLVLAGLFYQQQPKLNFNNDILALFPNDSRVNTHAEARQHALDNYGQYVSKQVFVLLGHRDQQIAQDAALTFSAAFPSGVFAKIKTRHDASNISQLGELFNKHAPLIISQSDKQQLQNDPTRFTQKKLRALFTNPTLLSSESFDRDPLSLSPQFLQGNLSAQAGNMEVAAGFVQAEHDDLTWVLVQAELIESAFSLAQQKRVIQAFDDVKYQLNKQYHDLHFVQDGAIFFAHSGATQAQKEISTVGLGSIVGIVALLIAAFLSVRVLAFALVPTAIGIVSGLLVCNAVFGQVHVIALVFGASLVGVSIDYAFHFLSTRQHSKESWHSLTAIYQLRWGLGLGAFTSACAYATFIFSGFPGFQQIAVFSGSGLIAACITVVTLFPWLFKKPARVSVLANIILKFCCYYLAIFPKKASVLVAMAILITLLFGIGLNTLKTGDDIRKMQSPSPNIIVEHQKFNNINGRRLARQFMLVSSSTEQGLLQRLEQVMTLAETKHSLPSSLATWIPSIATQKENLAFLETHLIHSGQIDSFLGKLPISAEKHAYIKNRFAGKNVSFLGFREGFEQISKALPQLLAFRKDGLYYGLIHFELKSFTENTSSSRNEPELSTKLTNANAQDLDTSKFKRIARQHDDIIWVDQVDDTNRLLKTYRERSIIVLFFAFTLVASILTMRYGLLNGLIVTAPPAFACALTVCALALVGAPLSLFNVMALVLVLGIGIDYSIFIRETRDHSDISLFAIALSATTTILSFGLLSLSQTDAIHGFGLTVFIGISLCFFFSPIAKLNGSETQNTEPKGT